MPVISVDDPADVRLAPFRELTDSALRRSVEARDGLYIAESLPVLERAIGAGHTVLSVLVAERWIERVAAVVDAATEILVAPASVVEAVTGFDVHRGVIAAVERPAPRAMSELLTGETVVILDGVTDTTNIGAIFRAAASLDAGAVILTPATGDPLYRRSVRVSMGTVFQVPWARAESWEALRTALTAGGYQLTALALTDDAVALEDFRPVGPTALAFGAEGDGLSPEALAAADVIVTIPMSGGVDSLNVAAASAVALWAVRAAARKVQ